MLLACSATSPFQCAYSAAKNLEETTVLVCVLRESTYDTPLIPDACEGSSFQFQRSFSVHLSFLPVPSVAFPSWKGARAGPMTFPSPEGAFVHTAVSFAKREISRQGAVHAVF